MCYFLTCLTLLKPKGFRFVFSLAVQCNYLDCKHRRYHDRTEGQGTSRAMNSMARRFIMGMAALWLSSFEVLASLQLYILNWLCFQVGSSGTLLSFRETSVVPVIINLTLQTCHILRVASTNCQMKPLEVDESRQEQIVKGKSCFIHGAFSISLSKAQSGFPSHWTLSPGNGLKTRLSHQTYSPLTWIFSSISRI